MRKWIVAMLVVGFVGMTVKADEHTTAAPSVDNNKKEEPKKVEDKSSKLFSYINACMVNTPAQPIDATTLVK